MNAERLLVLFDRVSEAPDAVPTLRRFVLDLAVRGKLVEQDLADEPAAELLRRIQEEKTRRIAAGEYRKDKAANSDPDDPPYALPSSWRWSRLSEIGFLNPRVSAPSDTDAGFVPMPLIAAEHGVANGHEPKPWGQISSGYTHFAEGDVGLAKITPCFENGKSTVFRGLPNGIGAGTTELHIVRPVLVDPDFILLFLKSAHFIECGIPRMTGTAGQKRVPSDYFANSPFPLPPLAEQRRIVARVDELMALCNQLEAARADLEHRRDRLTAATFADWTASSSSRQQEGLAQEVAPLLALTSRASQISQLRQTILNLAIRGRLVRQGSTGESVAELLHRIAVEKALLTRAGEIRKEKPLDPVTAENQPFCIPRDWSWVRLDQLTRLITKGSSPKWQGVSYVTPADGLLFITSENVGNYHLRKLGDLKYVEKRFRDVEPRSMLAKGDILMNLVGASIGRTALYDLDESANINQAVALVRLIDVPQGPLPSYLLHYFNSPASVSLMLKSRVATAQPNMSLADAREFPIPLPPLAEQHRVVARVDELMALCDQLEASLAAADTANAGLLDAILHEALNGPPRAEAA